MTTYGPARNSLASSAPSLGTEEHFCHEKANLQPLSKFETYGTVATDKSGTTLGTGWRIVRKSFSQVWNHVGTRSNGLESHTFEHPAVASPPTSSSSTGMARDSGRMLIHLASCSPTRAHPGVLVFCGECEVRDFTQQQDSAVGEDQHILEEGTEVGGRERAYGGERGWGDGRVADTGKERVVEEGAVERRNIGAWVMWLRRKTSLTLC